MSENDDGKKKDEGTTVTVEQFEELKSQLETATAEIDRYKAKHGEAEKHRKQAEADAQKAAEEAARKSGDTEALEKSWQAKLDAREAELQKQIDQRDGWLTEMTVGRSAESIAADLAVPGSASVLSRHIQDRLSTEIKDGRPTTIVVDAEGKPSALTLDDLKKEFSSNSAFAPLIAGNKASGSGGINGSGGGASKMDRAKMTNAQKVEYQKEHGQEAFLKLPNSNLTRKEA